MATHSIYGHSELREELARAYRTGRLPSVLLFVGVPGVGKQRLALWLAQLALCAERAATPCGRCRPCRLVLGLAHPDLHWFVPILRPKATEPDKQVEETAQALGEVLEWRRSQPLYSRPDGMAAHTVASARLLLRIAALTTVEGGRRVFIIGEADRLVPQESSPEAANALLKFLEEPPASALVILTTSEATRVLPTIRSRAAIARVGRLTDQEVDAFLREQVSGISDAERARRVALAEGSIGRALELAEGSAEHSAAVEELLAAVEAGPAGRLERSLRQGSWQARGDFTGLLDALAGALCDAARDCTGVPPMQPVPAYLRRQRDPARLLAALERVQTAREAAQGNLNPQLLLAVLTADLAEVL